MELTYKNKKLQNICENPEYNKELVKVYGSDVAKRLPQRIKELRAFDTLFDVPITHPFRRHKLVGDRSGEYAINITNQYRLIFISNENNILIDDLKEIKNIKILEVSKHYA